MRRPTTDPAALEWHTQALKDKALHIPVEVDYDTPACGWYLGRLVKGGPLVPARIFIEQDIDEETGELLDEEKLKCEVMGLERDAHEQWLWLFDEPITEAEYNRRKEIIEYAKEWAPAEPAANPFKPIDWGSVPTPVFNKEKDQ